MNGSTTTICNGKQLNKELKEHRLTYTSRTQAIYSSTSKFTASQPRINLRQNTLCPESFFFEKLLCPESMTATPKESNNSICGFAISVLYRDMLCSVLYNHLAVHMCLHEISTVNNGQNVLSYLT